MIGYLRAPLVAVLHVMALATPILLVPAGEVSAGQDGQVASPEDRLAAKHAPILYIARQRLPCDRRGDAYVPAPVDVVLGDPSVALREDAAGRPVIAMGPTAADLFRRGRDAFLDLPGNPRFLICTYERRFKSQMGERPALAYARIVREPDRPGLALQYWFFYYFNDWNNPHEGDWEMIQLAFDAASAAEALDQEPVRVAYAQHATGETAAWTEEKLRKEGDRPVVYVSRGSHASHFAADVYLGYGEDGAGFGCDDASQPARRVPVDVQLVPGEVDDQDDAGAWLTYEGLWGEKQRSHWSGPRGPNTKRQWTRPFTWEERLRGASITVANRDAAGPDPVDVLCRAVGAGAAFLSLHDFYPAVGYAALGVSLALVAWSALLARRVLVAAAVVYARHLPTFAVMGFALIPVGLAVNVMQHLIASLPPVALVLALMNSSPTAGVAVVLAVGGLEQIAVLLLVAPAVIHAVAEVRAGRSPSARSSIRFAVRHLRAVAFALGHPAAVVFALALSVVGLPWAVRQAVRWFFVEQAVVLDGLPPERARAASAGVVAGQWWRTMITVAVLVFLGTALGPACAIAVLAYSPASLDLAGTLSGWVYAATVPFAAIGATLLYEDLKARHRLSSPAPSPVRVA